MAGVAGIPDFIEDVTKSVIDGSALPNSLLNRQQADRFIDLLVDTSVLLKVARREKKDHAKGEVNKLDLATIVTEGANATSKARTSTPTESVVTYDMVKYRSAFDLRKDFLEDNLERDAIRDKVLGMFTKRMAIDGEMAAIQGDDSLTVGDSQSAENNLLGVNDGFQKILLANVPTSQIVNADGAAPSDDLYYAMRRKVPARYRVAKPSYRFIVPSGPADKWTKDWAGRLTIGGDQALRTGEAPGPWGVPMLEVPMFPEDLAFTAGSTTGNAGAKTDGSFIWYTPYENLIWFVQREITIEFDRKPRQDLWECTIHWRCDFEIENPDLVVVAKNVCMSGSDYSA
jgi:hypothetical protein